MCFVKYPEIENTYRQKFIDKFTSLYPELTKVRYKVDGVEDELENRGD